MCAFITVSSCALAAIFFGYFCFFLSLPSAEFNIIINKGVYTVGHGKSIVHLINGSNKHIILQAIAYQIKQTADVNNIDTKMLSVYIYISR